MTLFHSLLLSGIALCVCVCVRTHACHIFFIRSPVNGHLGCSHVLVVVNSAAMNLGCMYLFELEFSPDMCPAVGLLDYMVAQFLVIAGGFFLKLIYCWLLGLCCCTSFSLIVVSRGCSGCSAWASVCSGFSCGAQTSGMWAQELQFPGSRAQVQ